MVYLRTPHCLEVQAPPRLRLVEAGVLLLHEAPLPLRLAEAGVLLLHQALPPLRLVVAA